jgi:hypothetical protein
MKKLNVKKYNQFMCNMNNSLELKRLVETAADLFVNSEDGLNSKQILILQDLGLLSE